MNFVSGRHYRLLLCQYIYHVNRPLCTGDEYSDTDKRRIKVAWYMLCFVLTWDGPGPQYSVRACTTINDICTSHLSTFLNVIATLPMYVYCLMIQKAQKLFDLVIGIFCVTQYILKGPVAAARSRGDV